MSNGHAFAVFVYCNNLYKCIQRSLALYILLVLQNVKKYSQNTTIFIRYEWVDHIAFYNYMFRPLSAIVRLYYFLL